MKRRKITGKEVLQKEAEQDIKDTRSVDHVRDDQAKKAESAESKRNDEMQEKNKRSQKNAETESKYGDSSSPKKSTRLKKS